MTRPSPPIVFFFLISYKKKTSIGRPILLSGDTLMMFEIWMIQLEIENSTSVLLPSISKNHKSACLVTLLFLWFIFFCSWEEKENIIYLVTSVNFSVPGNRSVAKEYIWTKTKRKKKSTSLFRGTKVEIIISAQKLFLMTELLLNGS